MYEQNVKKTEQPTRKKRKSMFMITMRRLGKNKMAMAGLVIILLMIIIALLSTVLAPYPFEETDLYNTFGTPSKEHLFGTDELGRDILSRLMVGTKYSLRIGLLSVLYSSVIGIALGCASGYYGGKVDSLTMRFMDVFSAIPPLVLAIAICAVLGPGINNCIISIAISGTPSYVRMARASVLNVRKLEYLEAATAINCSTAQIIIKHILPNIMAPLIVLMTMSVANNILTASQLSFIGLGVQPPNPEWGAMLSAGRNYIRKYPHMVIFPGITIMLAVLSLNMVGDGLRDALDPKLKD
jgi:peptide/nickel transport system permease protein